MSENEAELRKKLSIELPPDEIDIHQEPDPKVVGSEGIAFWYDYFGVTFGKTPAEQQVINRWLLEVIGKKLGYEIERVRESDGNGHCTLWYKRKSAS